MFVGTQILQNEIYGRNYFFSYYMYSNIFVFHNLIVTTISNKNPYIPHIQRLCQCFHYRPYSPSVHLHFLLKLQAGTVPGVKSLRQKLGKSDSQMDVVQNRFFLKQDVLRLHL